MNEIEVVLSELSEIYTEENSLSEIRESLREDNSIGNLVISESLWRFSYQGGNYVIFNNRDQAERIAIQSVEQRLQNNDLSFDENILSRHLRVGSPDGFAYRQAKKKYEYMCVDELARDYRSGLSCGKEVSEHKIFEARSVAISSYANELSSILRSDPMRYFKDNYGIHSVFTVCERYSDFYFDHQSAAVDIVGRRGYGGYLSIDDDRMLFTAHGRVVAREYS